MPRRTRIDLEEIANYENLCYAFHQAARGKRDRIAVQQFADQLDSNLKTLRSEILDETIACGIFTRFVIHDPKSRVIHAADFTERVLHHAIMNCVGAVLDKGFIDETFACRKGKGTLAAVFRAQQHSRKFPWFVKMDIRRYFDSIDHDILLAVLKKRIKGKGILNLLDRIIRCYETESGNGLPIGSLTSQWFGNLYLNGIDRFAREELQVSGYVRYMDDMIVWSETRKQCKEFVESIREKCRNEYQLELKSPNILNRSSCGVTFCGFRISPHELKPTRRRKQRYALARKSWERDFQKGLISSEKLQSGYNSALAILNHCQASEWRKHQLKLRPVSIDT